MVDPAELRTLLAAVDRPVSVLVTPGRARHRRSWPSSASAASRSAAPSPPRRYGFAVEAVRQLQEKGTPNYWEQAGAVQPAMQEAFVKP